jgi:uncharacterized damage-inducible protein DinB
MKTLVSTSFMFLFFLSTSFSQSIDEIVTDFERAKAMSLAYIEAMPDDQFTFKPTPEIRSFAEQMLHAAQGNIGLSANGTGAESIYGTVNLEKDETLQSKTEVTRIVTESYDFAIKSIKGMDPSTFGEIVERGPYKVTRLGWVQKADEHNTHHRGQCAIYLRLAGITPPDYQLF